MSFLYVRQNFEQTYFGIIKIGSCRDPVSRDYDYKTNEKILRHLYKIFKLKNIPEGLTITDIEINIIHATLKRKDL
ncbi:unnamed protein product, partial [marine sediment metagenome]